MFEHSIDELDASATADALAAAHQAVLAAEARMFELAAHWADLHDGEELLAGPRPLPGQQRVVPIRGGRTGCVDGCPEVAEYAAAELAALTGRSTAAGDQLISDAVAVRARALQSSSDPVCDGGRSRPDDFGRSAARNASVRENSTVSGRVRAR
jgi:hypothetical protein